jgi:hypothetical protein
MGILALAVTAALLLALPGIANRLSSGMADVLLTLGPPFVGAALGVFLVRQFSGPAHGRWQAVLHGSASLAIGWMTAVAASIIGERLVLGPPGPESFSPMIEIFIGTVFGLPFAGLVFVLVWMVDRIPRYDLPPG